MRGVWKGGSDMPESPKRMSIGYSTDGRALSIGKDCLELENR